MLSQTADLTEEKTHSRAEEGSVGTETCSKFEKKQSLNMDHEKSALVLQDLQIRPQDSALIEALRRKLAKVESEEKRIRERAGDA